MARIGAVDTGPELTVRRLLHGLGYRFRLHRRSLPGSPDICFPGRRKAIFVHGCFWHRHEGCRRTTTPKTRTSFWTEKFEKNVERDRGNLQDLGELGWQAIVVWECETADLSALRPRLTRFLEARAPAYPDGETMTCDPLENTNGNWRVRARRSKKKPRPRTDTRQPNSG